MRVCEFVLVGVDQRLLADVYENSSRLACRSDAVFAGTTPAVRLSPAASAGLKTDRFFVKQGGE